MSFFKRIFTKSKEDEPTPSAPCSKKDKKAKKKAAMDKQFDDEVAKMPLSKANLKSLFDFLERADSSPCDHTFKETNLFIQQNSLDADAIIPWLNEYGGYCDCEVLMNVEVHWGKFVGRVFDDSQLLRKQSPYIRQSFDVEKRQSESVKSFTTGFGLSVESVNKPWKAVQWESGEPRFTVYYGKKKQCSIHFVNAPLQTGDSKSEDYWIKLWLEATDLHQKDEFTVEFNNVEIADKSFKAVSVRTTSWIPVCCWLFDAANPSWFVRIETEVSRFKPDLSLCFAFLRNCNI